MVSIPQSGFGAFEPSLRFLAVGPDTVFQSLSRDSGRLNNLEYVECVKIFPEVSIPQSGFGAFEPPPPPRSSFSFRCFNPSVGIRGV